MVLLANHFKLWGGGGSRTSGPSQRLLDAFHGALPDLVLGVFVFSFAVMIASLMSIVTAHGEPDSVTTYDIVTGVLVAVFSVCPATLLYCQSGQFLGKDDKSEDGEDKIFKNLLRAILFALWVLMLAVVNLGQRTDPSKEALEAGSVGHPFEVYCQVIGSGPLEAVRIFAVASAGLGALWVLYLIFRKRRQGSKDMKRRWPAVVSLLAWVVMWFFLGLFTVLRARIIEVAGESDKSNEWGFGQIIALAAWVPVILTFFHILLCKSFPRLLSGRKVETEIE
jgi:hypothetical protein